MSTLTKNERDALDEVFRSIKTSTSRYEKIKSILSLWLGLHMSKKAPNEASSTQTEKFGDKITKNFNVFTKVKKNLSK